MANVFDVADFLINVFEQEEDGITQLKLNKLLYYAQGAHLAKTGNPLFNDAIEAWELGPVVPAVYQKYKYCGRNPIVSDNQFFTGELNNVEYETLLDVVREYGKYTASYLVRKTHEFNTSWAQTMRNKNKIIENALITTFFTHHEKVPSFNDQLSGKNNSYVGYRDASGILVLPAEEDDGDWDEYNDM